MQIDPKTHSVVDLASCEEIKNAIAADPETGWVKIRVLTYDGEHQEDHYYPSGVRILRRH